MDTTKNLLDKASEESKTMDECLRLVACAMLTKCNGKRPAISVDAGKGENEAARWNSLTVTFHVNDCLDVYEYVIFNTFCEVDVRFGEDDRETHSDCSKAAYLLNEFLSAHNYEL